MWRTERTHPQPAEPQAEEVGFRVPGEPVTKERRQKLLEILKTNKYNRIACCLGQANLIDMKWRLQQAANLVNAIPVFNLYVDDIVENHGLFLLLRTMY